MTVYIGEYYKSNTYFMWTPDKDVLFDKFRIIFDLDVKDGVADIDWDQRWTAIAMGATNSFGLVQP